MNGVLIDVRCGVVLGRQPEPETSSPHAALVALQEQSLSKTSSHATISPTQTGVTVVDHHSTNGTTGAAHGLVRPAVSGSPTDAPAGSVLMHGELALRVEVA